MNGPDAKKIITDYKEGRMPNGSLRNALDAAMKAANEEREAEFGAGISVNFPDINDVAQGKFRT